MGATRNCLGADLSRGLHHAAMTLLVAGTFYVANPDRPGSLLIGLDSLSTVSVRSSLPLWSPTTKHSTTV